MKNAAPSFVKPGAPAPAAAASPAATAVQAKVTAAAAVTAAPCVVAAADNGNAMAQTYGFLRTASNNVGNTVEGVLGVEGSLTDMKKDLDQEYARWMVKKKVLVGDRDKLTAEIARYKGLLLSQKEMRGEVERVTGDIASTKAENAKIAAANQEKEAKRKLEKKGQEEDIHSLKCAMKAIQQAKQDKVDSANNKTMVLKSKNRLLQEQVFKLNKEVQQLIVKATNQNIKNKEAVSSLLAQVEAVQGQIHGLEKELVAQAQLEETVQRARERLSKQSSETVKQRGKLTEAQATCMSNNKKMVSQIEGARRTLNAANVQMMQCQNLDAVNQKMQSKLNECIYRKRSSR